MKAQHEKLPITMVSLLVLVYFQKLTFPYLLIWGLIYIIGQTFFINKAIYGKREWIYYEIVTSLRTVVLITLYFKIR